jgi:hypothetical protein
MKKLDLSNITLYGADTKDKERLLNVFKICEHYANFGAKKLFTKTENKKNYTTESGIEIIHTEDISSLKDYNWFNMKKLNDFVKTDYVLVVEHDGFILNPEAWTDEFLKYDWVGAPWWYNDDCNVGNGGFSLRSKKLLETLQKDSSIIGDFPDDHHTCRTYGEYLKEKGIKFAPEEIASKFSIEGGLLDPNLPVKYGSEWSGEFGFHGLNKTNISAWKNPLNK